MNGTKQVHTRMQSQCCWSAAPGPAGVAREPAKTPNHRPPPSPAAFLKVEPGCVHFKNECYFWKLMDFLESSFRFKEKSSRKHRSCFTLFNPPLSSVSPIIHVLHGGGTFVSVGELILTHYDLLKSTVHKEWVHPLCYVGFAKCIMS